MITMYLPAQERGKALGIMTTFVSVGIAAGPVLGGFLSEYLSWHWIFLINVPIGIVAIILGIATLPRDRIPPSGEKERFDAPGAGILFVALGTFIFAINMERTLGWTSPAILGSFIVCLLTFIAFVLWEHRCSEPLIDMKLFSDRDFTFTNLTALLAMFLVSGSSFILPFYLELVKGLKTDMAGILLMVPAIAMMVLGPIAGCISDKFGSKKICIAASFSFIGGYLMYWLMNTGTGYLHIIAALALMGAGAGLYIPPNFRMILNISPKGSEGVVSSVAMTMRNVGAVVAVAIYGTIFVSVAMAAGATSDTSQGFNEAALLAGFHSVFLFGAVMGVIILAVTLMVKEKTGEGNASQEGWDTGVL